MTMKFQYSKRIIAVAVALMLLLGTLFTGAVTASAESLADGLTEVATSATDGGNYSGFNGFRTITDLPGGGITMLAQVPVLVHPMFTMHLLHYPAEV